MNIMIIDLATKTTTLQPVSDPLIGGRLLTAQLTQQLTDPKTDPLGSGNILVFATGALAGYRVSTAGRLSVGGKSPLTNGIKESNAGGMAGDSLAALGYRALVFKNVLPEDQPSLFILDEKGGRFENAQQYWGMGNEELSQRLHKDYGEDYAIISIGPAGEQQLRAAGLAVTDANNKPFRLAARGGMGAVMGSKRLKAVLIRKPAKNFQMTISKEARQAITAFNKHVAVSPRVQVLREYGTASTVMLVQKLGGMVVRNFSRGEFEYAENISGEKLTELIRARGGVGTPTEFCMAGCVIQCSNVFPDEEGKLAAAPVEFETIGLCGANLELKTFDDIARINRLCNDLGLDTIEIGAALGVMMEAAEQDNDLPEPYRKDQLPRFGDATRAAELVAEIGKGTPLGKLLGNGVVATGQALGSKRIPAVKGQAMSAYDPRVIKGTGVTYATSPQGADHTAGLTVFAPVDHKDKTNAIALSRSAQIQRAAYDALGLCVFNLSATGQHPNLIIQMLNFIYQKDLPGSWLDELGMEVIKSEIDFNKQAGLTADDNRIPPYFKNEPIPPTYCTFDISDEELDQIWNT